MISLFFGSLLISLLHALIPNHWLPALAIGRKEGWDFATINRVTFISGLAHVVSTVLIGLVVALIGKELSFRVDQFTHIIAPIILLCMGLYFIWHHYRHHHFKIDDKKLRKKSVNSIIFSLVIAMFLSPCMEIEAYFLLAGTYGWIAIAAISLMYGVITIAGMLIWLRFVYRGLLKFNWHRWEHNAGIITGAVLIGTGIITYLIG